ncbi:MULTISPECIES: hypothetical protein [unclassified Serratia (in: enterobacteria)]|uniref:hypothetical protein n=1 Tax=unclassified Serratia (in: enterobacteria) TaxID=2647522 RepID=UPI002ED4F5B8|nr:hypothetical protein [Serratia sp. C2(2)]MEE4449602.1 hypothetical protein [Serratia sp. C2(1)]
MKFTPQKCDAFKSVMKAGIPGGKTALRLREKRAATEVDLCGAQAGSIGCEGGFGAVGMGTRRGERAAKSVNSKGMDEMAFSSLCDLYRKMKCFFCNVILWKIYLFIIASRFTLSV